MNFLGIFVAISLAVQLSPTPRNGTEEQGHSNHDQKPAEEIARRNPWPQGVASVNTHSSTKKAKKTPHKASYICRATAPEYLSQWVLVGIGGIGVFFGLLSLRAARQSADVANASLRVLERARLYVSKFTFIPVNNGTEFEYSVEITNAGNTPGTIFERQFTYWPTSEPLPEVPPAEGGLIEDDLTIQGKQAVPYRTEQRHPLPSAQDVYIVGIIRYRDVFNDTQTTRFCAQYVRGEAASIITKPGYITAT